MRVREFLTVTSVTLLGLTMAACGNNSSNKARGGQTLHLMQAGELQSLDHSNEANIYQWNVLENSMEGLYRADKENNPTPALATKLVKPTNHGTRYTFKLRKDAKWSNGDPVVAQDFVASWRRSTSPASRSGYAYIFTGVKNATEVTNGKKPVKDLGIQALDKYTLQVDQNTQ